jgi:putative ATP-binding cassette transporter
MLSSSIPIDRENWARFVRSVRSFANSKVGTKAKVFFASLIVLLFAINGLNVVNSYVGRDFFTAIANRDMSGFVRQALLYIGVFGLSTVVAVGSRFCEERLGLLWREGLTRQMLNAYVEHPTFYRLNDHIAANGEIGNPDQRIADDVKTFTTMTLSFVLMFLNGGITVFAFAGVLWSISPLLFIVGFGYAALGSLLTVVFGRPLVGLTSAQLDREANFRAELVHLQENAELVALSRNEAHVRARLVRRVDDLVQNQRRIIGVNRNLGFFTTGYNYLIQIIPALIVAPMFIRGQAEFGVVTQSAMAFSQLLGAFSLVVTQFQSITSFTAVVARLGDFGEAIELAQSVGAAMDSCAHRTGPDCAICLTAPAEVSRSLGIKVREDDGAIAYEGLTLRSGPDQTALVSELNVAIARGTHVLLAGDHPAASLAIFRATAGVWDVGEGILVRPGSRGLMFLPERPYLPRGTLREILLHPELDLALDLDRMRETFALLELDQIIERAGGLDTEQDWNLFLSLGEQQAMAFARLMIAAPQFAFLDRPTTILGAERVGELLRALRTHSITYLTIGDADGLDVHHDATLVLASDGSWTWTVRGGVSPRDP